jgi:hypothetical protein
VGISVEPTNQVAEAEPNDEKSSATAFDLGTDGLVTLSGTATSDKDRDDFVFTPRTSGRLTLTVRGGSGPRAKLELEDSAGNNLLEIQTDDDGVTTRDVAVTAGSR